MKRVAKKRLAVILLPGALAIGAALLFSVITGPSNHQRGSVSVAVTVLAVIAMVLLVASLYLQAWKKSQKQKGESKAHMSLSAAAGLIACAAGGASIFLVPSLFVPTLLSTIPGVTVMLCSLAGLFLISTGAARKAAKTGFASPKPRIGGGLFYLSDRDIKKGPRSEALFTNRSSLFHIFRRLAMKVQNDGPQVRRSAGPQVRRSAGPQ